MTTEQLHPIAIPSLPKGYRAVEIMVDPMSCNYIGDDGYTYITAKIKIEKIQPRRIVIEETKEFRQVLFDEWGEDADGRIFHWNNEEPSISCNKIWRVVEEE